MRLVVVTGVGTGIGKTHVARAILRAWGRVEPVLGYKPVESGVAGAVGEDEAVLRDASTFHVKHPPLQVRLGAPVSPHLAARLEGRVVPLEEIVREVETLRAMTTMVVELPGGLFSPLTDQRTGADLVRDVRPDVVLLVAPNRLGVLHDVGAVSRACRGVLPLDGVVLCAPIAEDASTATNGRELERTTGRRVLASLPRGSPEALVSSGALDSLVEYCRGLLPDRATL
jgi:dethiobiotin synthetase